MTKYWSSKLSRVIRSCTIQWESWNIPLLIQKISYNKPMPSRPTWYRIISIGSLFHPITVKDPFRKPFGSLRKILKRHYKSHGIRKLLRTFQQSWLLNISIKGWTLSSRQANPLGPRVQGTKLLNWAICQPHGHGLFIPLPSNQMV